MGIYPMSRKNRDRDAIEIKVIPDSEKIRKVQKIEESYYSNIPKSHILEKARSAGLSIVDFLINYEMVLYEEYPADGNAVLDGRLVITWRRIKDEAT